MTGTGRDGAAVTARVDVVPRHRLVERLNGRFTHRVTTVIAEAGFGKTTTLALAVESNRLDPIGRDAWLRVGSADRVPERFIGSLAKALDVEAGAFDERTVDRLVDSMWSAAPDDIALIVDDAHELVGSEATKVLEELLGRFPTNAHLVLVGRRPLDLPLARLRAHGEVLSIDDRDLALDDDELDALRQLRGSETVDVSLPRHAATADLRLAAGTDASSEFLWEEVLARYPSDRLAHLRRIAVLDVVDDELVDVMTDGAFDTSSLLDRTPLVDRSDDGTARLHDILREALVKRLEPGERRKALAIAADAERHRFRLPRAVELYREAGDNIGALETARQFALIPTMLQTYESVLAVRRTVAQIDPDSTVHRILDATTHLAGLEGQVAEMFLRAADAAVADHDDDLEILALYRAAQSQLLHHDHGYYATFERLRPLVERNRFAAGVHAYLSSISHQFRGEAAEGLAVLDGLDQLERPMELVARAERLYDLGRPERVAVGMTIDDFVALPQGADAFIGLAMWRRGDASPDDALLAVESSVQRSLRQGFTHPSVSTLGSAALIALAAGENELARRFAEHAHDLTRSGVGVIVAEMATIARAAVAAVTDGDDAAAGILAAATEPTAFSEDATAFPSRAQLGSMTMVYVCDPSTRAMLDGVDVGPTLRTAIAAGQAIVALRDLDDATGAAALPWHQPNALRANVLPPHLAELAAAATSLGNTAARELLDALPHRHRLLQRVATGPSRIAARAAVDLLGAMPRIEPFTLEVRMLGPLQIVRNGERVDTGQIAKRPKIRELLGLLLERGRMDRRDIVAQLWPDHDDDDRALGNLRTALSTLNDVLEPNRAKGASAFHLLVEGDAIALDERVTDDVSAFERLTTDAQRDDRSGLPARALDAYMEAASLYRGEYLAGLDAPWLVLPRLRLQSLAVGTMCRISELVAARGEPETAARWAGDARAIDPLNQRAGRLFVAALDAMGARSAAVTAIVDLLDVLTADGIQPEPATERLAQRLLAPSAGQR